MRQLDAEHLMRTVTLRSLRVFEQAFAHRSAVGAARALNLTQSAVTKSIQTLEDALGIELFVRTNRGLEPTEYACSLQQRIKLLLADFRDLADEANSFMAGESGHVAVGTLVSASLRLLPLSLSLLEQAAPRVHVSVEEGTVEQLFPLLATGQLAVVVGRVPHAFYPWVKDGLVSSEALLDEVLCLVTGRHHPLQGAARVSLQDLAGYRWILPSPPAPTRAVVEQMFADARLPLPRYSTESLSLLSNVGMLLHSDAIGVLPSSSAQEFRRLGVLHILPMDRAIAFGQIGFSVRASGSLTPATRRFIEALRSAAAQVRADSQI